MVTNAPLSYDVSLPAALAARARAASNRRLTLDLVAGLLAVSGLTMWRPFAWQIGAGAAVGLISFAVWGIAERAIETRGRTRPRVVTALRLAQAISIFTAAISGLVAGFVALGIGLGTIIS
jgi:hypothetical protein